MCDTDSVLIVVDMQNDFISGALGTPEAAAIVGKVAEKIRTFPGTVAYTLDTHGPAYLETQEGSKLPVPHCIKGTTGWQVPDALQRELNARNARAFEKGTFGSVELAQALAVRHAARPISAVELVGVCTDICVVSNALVVKAFLPEVPLYVDAACCAGVTPAAHEAALATLQSCQVTVTRERA